MTGSAGRAGFDVQGHRGALGYRPGNTLAGFELAGRLGASAVELDVRLSADGVAVVWHDPVLTSGTCLPADPRWLGRRVDELTATQLKHVDIGSLTNPGLAQQVPAQDERLLTLSDVLLRVSVAEPAMRFVVEVKVDPDDESQRRRSTELVERTLDDIHSSGVSDRVAVHSFDWAVLALAADLAPHVRRSALASVRVSGAWLGDGTGPAGAGSAGLRVEDLPAAARDAGAHVVCPHFGDAFDEMSADPGVDPPGREFVDRCHAVGLTVIPWTVDTPADLRLVVDAGVDGVVTNYPDRARAVAGWGVSTDA
ncbi:MAG: glycerophosphodiester phosphodiesterase family protein [Dermatophilaceae bacterium]